MLGLAWVQSRRVSKLTRMVARPRLLAAWMLFGCHDVTTLLVDPPTVNANNSRSSASIVTDCTNCASDLGSREPKRGEDAGSAVGEGFGNSFGQSASTVADAADTSSVSKRFRDASVVDPDVLETSPRATSESLSSSEPTPAVTLCQPPKGETCNVAIWPNGIIPYAFEGGWPEEARSRVEAAIETWNSVLKPEIRFEAANAAENAEYIAALIHDGCQAQRGMIGPRTTVNLGACSARQALAVLGRLAGLAAHHLRSDRDEHVNMRDEACTPSWLDPNPVRCVNGETTDLGEYDLHSIMHPSSEELEPGCTKRNDCNLRDLNGDPIDGVQTITTGDISAALELYASAAGWRNFKRLQTSPAQALATQDAEAQVSRVHAIVPGPETVEVLSSSASSIVSRQVVTPDGLTVESSSSTPLPGMQLAALGATATRVDLVGELASGGLAHCTRAVGEWHCTEIDVPLLGSANSEYTIAIEQSGRVNLFNVSDGRLFWRRFLTEWTAWEEIGGCCVGPTLAAASWLTDRVDLVSQFPGNPHQVVATTFTGGTTWFGGWAMIGGGSTVGSNLAMASPRPLDYDVFVQSERGGLMMSTYRGSKFLNWKSWSRLTATDPRFLTAAGYGETTYVLVEYPNSGLWLGALTDPP